MLIVLLLLATTMAIYGVLGYLKGSKWALIALLILLAAFFLIKFVPDSLITLFNGLYLGVMLTLKGGLGAIASGDLDAAAAILEDIERPFNDENENIALLLVILGAAAVGLILAAVMKSKSNAMGLVLGLVYGYVLSAAILPLISTNPDAQLPVPVLQPAERTATVAEAQAANALDTFWTALAQPQNIQILAIVIGALIALILLFSVRKGVKKG